ncbi:MAG: L-seryl-tRNA(Sec) selenium transferase [Gemmatimonadales bacterium]
MRLAAIPSVDRILQDPRLAPAIARHGRPLVVGELRALLAEYRTALKAGTALPPNDDAIALGLLNRLEAAAQPSLRRVFNLTGTVLHTNLGRALLPQNAIEASAIALSSPTNLEYDLEAGERGERDDHHQALLCRITGAEAATAVNNNAGAVLLAMNTLAAGREVVVSRGELVEIGGSFRIPDIMARSGARLVEVGTTNRTHRQDYEAALTADSRVLLKVHRSNFQLSGFTADVAARELGELARARGIPCLYDLGSGLLLDLAPWGLTGEPTVAEAVASGAEMITFSGDKLLGGPQAGILLGSEAAIAACRADPIARALRADKLTLAALEATLALYRDPETARREIPVLRMLTETPEDVKRRGEALKRDVGDARAELINGASEVGGGSFPGAKLPTWLVRLTADRLTADALAGRLRGGNPPIIARIADDRVVLDPRTIFPDQVDVAARAVAAALSADG